MKKDFIIFIVIATLITACKYEDGPLVSLRSKQDRIIAIWEVESLTIDGVDSTSLYNETCDCAIALYEDYDGIKTCRLEGCKRRILGIPTGSWKFINNDKNG